MPRHNVGYIKPPEPDFIKRMKEQIGWKEGPDVETKREQLSAATDDDYDDRGDELPTVVVLKKGDLTADEAQEEIEKQKKIEDDVPAAGEGGRILFRKPTKRSSEEASSSTIGPKKTSDDKSKKSDSKDSKSSKDAKRPKQNKKLLSFNDEEDEDS